MGKMLYHSEILPHFLICRALCRKTKTTIFHSLGSALGLAFFALLCQGGDGVLNAPRNFIEKHALMPVVPRQHPLHFDALVHEEMLCCEVAVSLQFKLEALENVHYDGPGVVVVLLKVLSSPLCGYMMERGLEPVVHRARREHDGGNGFGFHRLLDIVKTDGFYTTARRWTSVYSEQR